MPRLMGISVTKCWLFLQSAGLSLEDKVTSTRLLPGLFCFVVSWNCHSPPTRGSELFTERVTTFVPT